MMEFLGSIFWLAVALGLLVTFHEFGHYWVARRAGVRVLKFSVGFGRAILRRRSADGVEFAIGAIPLGGYVKMLDERETQVAPGERHLAFNRQPLGKRTAIVAAGPIFNLIFAVAAFWLMFMLGIPEQRPVVGATTGLAAEAGLERGDLIISVGDRSVQTWTHALLALVAPAIDRNAVRVTVETEAGEMRSTSLALDRLGDDFREDRALEAIGIEPWRADLPPVIGSVSPDSPAERAGLVEGDRIVEIEGRAIDGWLALVEAIPAAAGDDAVRLRYQRQGRLETIVLEPDRIDGRPVIGVAPAEPGPQVEAAAQRAFTVMHFGPIEALTRAVSETWRLTGATLGILGRMVTGDASLSNLSGPITIAQLANDSARLGMTRFLFFLGLISLSLAIINLLPIPVLDGGQLLYFLIEWVKGSPVSENGQMIGQGIGLAMIAGLMGIAIFNDLIRLVQ